MKKTTALILIPLVAAGAMLGLAGGVASAAPAEAAPAASDTPIWLLPGVDLGGLHGAPTELFAPVVSVLTLFAG